jgi:DNA-binding MarR family transcriptional regulator
MLAETVVPVVVAATSESPVNEPATDDIDIDIATLRAAVLVLARRLRHQVAGDEISTTEGAVLGHLGRCGAMTPGQLARAEHIQPPSMTRVIELLERREFVRREPHPTDGRQILVTRTEAGDAFVQASKQVRSAWLRERIDQLEPASRQALADATDALSRLAAMP